MNDQTTPSPTPRTTWPYWLALCLLIAGLGHVTSIREWWLATDVSISRTLNGMLGANKFLDDVVVALASNPGDKGAFLAFALLLLAHCLYPRDRDEKFRRMGFWLWTGVAFALFFLVHMVLEHHFKRPSASKVIEHWNDLHARFGDEVITRRKNTFPSGHASAWYFFAFMGMRRYHRVAPILLAISLILPIARVFSGAHWAGDLLWGSIPLMLFAAALFTETPLARGYHFCHAWLRAWWAFVWPLGGRNFSDRAIAGSREFADTIERGLSDTSRTRGIR